jgi:hypothetical protein
MLGASADKRMVSALKMMKAILTDVQFWIPALVLLGGIVLLVVLH